MSFSLKNVGATYQRMVNNVFKDKMDRNKKAYMDDILVKNTNRISTRYSKSMNPSKYAFIIQAQA